MSLLKGELVSLMRGFCHTSMIRLPIVIAAAQSLMDIMNIREGSSVLKFSDDSTFSASELSFIVLHVATNRMNYYAALLPRRGPHIASHSVCLSVCPSVPLSDVLCLQ